MLKINLKSIPKTKTKQKIIHEEEDEEKNDFARAEFMPLFIGLAFLLQTLD